MVPHQPRQKEKGDLISKNSNTKKGWWSGSSGEGLEFNPQCPPQNHRASNREYTLMLFNHTLKNG
jgi:hypothetical protein